MWLQPCTVYQETHATPKINTVCWFFFFFLPYLTFLITIQRHMNVTESDMDKSGSWYCLKKHHEHFLINNKSISYKQNSRWGTTCVSMRRPDDVMKEHRIMFVTGDQENDTFWGKVDKRVFPLHLDVSVLFQPNPFSLWLLLSSNLWSMHNVTLIKLNTE